MLEWFHVKKKPLPGAGQGPKPNLLKTFNIICIIYTLLPGRARYREGTDEEISSQYSVQTPHLIFTLSQRCTDNELIKKLVN